jgi:hypothetical protein
MKYAREARRLVTPREGGRGAGDQLDFRVFTPLRVTL